MLEVVDRREAVFDAAGVDQHDPADGAADELVPQEEEAVLTRRSEHVEDHVGPEREPAEVHRDRRTGLGAARAGEVDAEALDGDVGLGHQRFDLGDRADQRGLADRVPTGHDDLHRYR